MTAPPIDRVHGRLDVAALVEWLGETGTADIADAMADLHPCDAALVLRLLPRERAIDVFEMLGPVHQHQVLDGLCDERVRSLLVALDQADRERLPGEVPAKVANRFIGRLATDECELQTIVLGYPDGSVGRHVTSEFVSLRRSMTAVDARSKIRRHRHTIRDVGLLPVLDDQRRVVGACDTSIIDDTAPATRLRDVMVTDPPMVTTSTSEADAVELMREAALDVLPVVDSEHRLVGLVTAGDLDANLAVSAASAA